MKNPPFNYRNNQQVTANDYKARKHRTQMTKTEQHAPSAPFTGADTSVRRMRSAALPIQQQAKQKGGEVRFLSSLACEGKSLSPSSLKSSASTCTSDGPSVRQTKTLVPDWATTRQSSIHKIELFTEKSLEVVFTDDWVLSMLLLVTRAAFLAQLSLGN